MPIPKNNRCRRRTDHSQRQKLATDDTDCTDEVYGIASPARPFADSPFLRLSPSVSSEPSVAEKAGDFSEMSGDICQIAGEISEIPREIWESSQEISQLPWEFSESSPEISEKSQEFSGRSWEISEISWEFREIPQPVFYPSKAFYAHYQALARSFARNRWRGQSGPSKL